MSLHNIQVSKRFQDSSIIKVFKHKECLLFLEKLGIQICEKHSNAKKLVLHLPSRLSLLQFLLLQPRQYFRQNRNVLKSVLSLFMIRMTILY